MAVNPDKKRCSVEGCRAWAMRGSERCASHSRAVGAPKGNQNAVKHGYFRRNEERMRYGHFHSLGYPIGSGTVESGAKNVGLGVRLLPTPPKLPKTLSYTQV